MGIPNQKPLPGLLGTLLHKKPRGSQILHSETSLGWENSKKLPLASKFGASWFRDQTAVAMPWLKEEKADWPVPFSQWDPRQSHPQHLYTPQASTNTNVKWLWLPLNVSLLPTFPTPPTASRPFMRSQGPLLFSSALSWFHLVKHSRENKWPSVLFIPCIPLMVIYVGTESRKSPGTWPKVWQDGI